MGGTTLSAARIDVDGRVAAYRAAGDGPPVLFLHGWGLGSGAYQRAVTRLARRGCRVCAPTLPGFAGSADLPSESTSITGYGEWVDHFMTAVDMDEPAMVIGHSFGGGVGIKLAQLHPERVGYLVLLNSVGSGTDPPIWEWALRFARELFPNRQGIEIARAMRDDLVSNLVRNPLGLVRVAQLARAADLHDELSELRLRELPVLALTTSDDGIVPRAAFEGLCDAIGATGQVLAGRHSWLLADPDSFDEVLANVVEVRVAEHRAGRTVSRAQEIADVLAVSLFPARRAASLLESAPPLWLMSAPAEVLAGDLVLCTPRLARGEVRAVARPLESGAIRLTVVARDRRGLLADTTAVLATHGLSISHASAATWTRQHLALHALTIEDAGDLNADGWRKLGADLRTASRPDDGAAPMRRPVERLRVTVDGGSSGRTLVRLVARDQVGLLARICRWFSDAGHNVESLHASTDGETVRDVFLVSGDCDGTEFARQLTRPESVRPSRGRHRCGDVRTVAVGPELSDPALSAAAPR
jgi:pimeloyl-ACP methyl ester carboxylesterase